MWMKEQKDATNALGPAGNWGYWRFGASFDANGWNEAQTKNNQRWAVILYKLRQVVPEGIARLIHEYALWGPGCQAWLVWRSVILGENDPLFEPKLQIVGGMFCDEKSAACIRDQWQNDRVHSWGKQPIRVGMVQVDLPELPLAPPQRAHRLPTHFTLQLLVERHLGNEPGSYIVLVTSNCMWNVVREASRRLTWQTCTPSKIMTTCIQKDEVTVMNHLRSCTDTVYAMYTSARFQDDRTVSFVDGMSYTDVVDWFYQHPRLTQLPTRGKPADIQKPNINVFS